jgi:hypothetical protein
MAGLGATPGLGPPPAAAGPASPERGVGLRGGRGQDEHVRWQSARHRGSHGRWVAAAAGDIGAVATASDGHRRLEGQDVSELVGLTETGRGLLAGGGTKRSDMRALSQEVTKGVQLLRMKDSRTGGGTMVERALKRRAAAARSRQKEFWRMSNEFWRMQVLVHRHEDGGEHDILRILKAEQEVWCNKTKQGRRGKVPLRDGDGGGIEYAQCFGDSMAGVNFVDEQFGWNIGALCAPSARTHARTHQDTPVDAAPCRV